MAIGLLVAAALPAASVANGPMGGTQTTKVTLPPNGDGTVQAAPMPSTVTKGTIKVNSGSASWFHGLTEFLTSKPTFGARAVSCVLMYAEIGNYPDAAEDVDLQEPTLQLLFLHVCIKLAAALSQPGAASHGLGHATAGGCPLTTKSVPVTITRSGSGYAAHVQGTTRTVKNAGYRVSCSRTATSVAISVRPKSARTSLPSAFGSRLELGLLSASSSSGTAKVALTVK